MALQVALERTNLDRQEELMRHARFITKSTLAQGTLRQLNPCYTWDMLRKLTS